MDVQQHKVVWDELGGEDPLWAILAEPDARRGKWDVDRFFARGDTEIAEVWQKAQALGLPRERRTALDFGCGVGRLTRALSKYFDHCHGIDISSPMIEHARRYNDAVGAPCTFTLNTETNLRVYQDNTFDLIYSRLVLQHQPSQEWIRAYLREFARTLKPGGLMIFQIPSGMPLRARLNFDLPLYRVLRAFGASSDFLLKRLNLVPVATNWLPERDVRATLEASGARVLRADPDDSSGPVVPSRMYYVTKP